MRFKLDPLAPSGVSVLQPVAPVIVGGASTQNNNPGSGQTWYVDQLPVETPDGSLKDFTLPSGTTYLAGYIAVYLNGLMQTHTIDFAETSSSTIRFIVAPLNGDIIRLNYRTS